MANNFGSLYIATSGLQNSQQALNVVANNLANVDTAGYVRQQVLFADRDYVTYSTSTAISHQQSGLGVTIGDVVHTRDVFLDRSYRTETGREAFYTALYDAASEIEDYLQEMEGATFQSALEDFWEVFQEYAKAPDDSINQTLLIQSAGTFLSRASAVYSGIQSYQYNLNTQISDAVDEINSIGKQIASLNKQIAAIEAGGLETAMTLRDERDLLLDELSELANISYTETASGIVKVSIEGNEFVTEAGYNTIALKTDKVTGFVTPYWENLSDTAKGKYYEVFNLDNDISSATNSDIGKVKAMLLARGDSCADYTDVEGLDSDTYNSTTGKSIMMTIEAQLDQLVHTLITSINDLLCPNTEASNYITALSDGTATSVTAYDADGNAYEITADTLILDADNCAVGSDGELPPQELSSRIGSDRYTTASYTDEDGEEHTIYIYNEEDASDSSKQYTLASVSVNENLEALESLLPYLSQNGDVDYELAAALAAVWDEELLTLNPDDTNAYSFLDYYTNMVGDLATAANIYSSTASTLSASVASIESSRDSVIGVSSDEELTNMIKYQNAYNASSRYFNVVNEMIEYLLNQLG